MTNPKVRERNALNRCNSDTDSKVWMEEDLKGYTIFLCSGGIQSIFYWRIAYDAVDRNSK